MRLGINLLMYLTEIASKSLGRNFLSKIFEIHHKHKKDFPSGTALMLGKGIAVGRNKNFYSLLGKKYLNKKTFPYSNKINFNSLRKGERRDTGNNATPGWWTVSSGTSSRIPMSILVASKVVPDWVTSIFTVSRTGLGLRVGATLPAMEKTFRNDSR